MPCSAGEQSISSRDCAGRYGVLTVELVVVMRVAEVGQQLLDAVRVEREQVLRVRRIPPALQVEHWPGSGEADRALSRPARRPTIRRDN